jgi:hypothetical protein
MWNYYKRNYFLQDQSLGICFCTKCMYSDQNTIYNLKENWNMNYKFCHSNNSLINIISILNLRNTYQEYIQLYQNTFYKHHYINTNRFNIINSLFLCILYKTETPFCNKNIYQCLNNCLVYMMCNYFSLCKIDSSNQE